MVTRSLRLVVLALLLATFFSVDLVADDDDDDIDDAPPTSADQPLTDTVWSNWHLHGAISSGTAARPGWRVRDALQVGLNLTTGNAPNASLTFRNKFSIGKGAFRDTLSLGATYSHSVDATGTGVTTQDEMYSAKNQAEYHFAADLFTFLSASYFRDVFLGFRQIVELGGGPGLYLIDRENLALSVQTGYVWSHEQRVASADAILSSALFGAKFHWQITDAVLLEQEVDFLVNLGTPQDLRARTTTTLSVPLGRLLTLSMSFDTRFDNLPVAGFTTLDTTTVASLGVQL